ncbi:hypothetical protein ACWKW9_11570 [Rhizobium daejeonense]
MKRAFVGFSTCIGYDYRNQAKRTKSDTQSSPNPVLYGATALMLLYDEIWFACESLCPQSMRKLPYVRFLGESMLGDDQGSAIEQESRLLAKAIDEAVELYSSESYIDIRDTLPKRFTTGAVDNHTHGLNALGLQLQANSGTIQLAIDLVILANLKLSDLEIVLNPQTSKAIWTPFGATDTTSDGINFSNIELSERLINVNSTYDYTAVKGPYHPIIDEMRADPLLKDFRRWLSGNTSRLDNQEIRDIEREINQKITDLTDAGIRKYVAKTSLVHAPAQMLRSAALSIMPPANGFAKAIEIMKANKKADALRWLAFIALSRNQLQSQRPIEPTELMVG